MKKLLISFAAILATLVILACSSTVHEVRKESLAPDWIGEPYEKLLIIGVYEDRPFRISSEITFSDELKARGVTASPSYEMIPDLHILEDSAAIHEATSSKGFDALLTVATTEVNEEYTYEDAMATRGLVYLLGGRPGAATETGILISALTSGTYALHIGLWDAKTQDQVWQASTHSVFQETDIGGNSKPGLSGCSEAPR